MTQTYNTSLIRRFAIICAIGTALMTLTACNAMQGLGSDIAEFGKTIRDVAKDTEPQDEKVQPLHTSSPRLYNAPPAPAEPTTPVVEQRIDQPMDKNAFDDYVIVRRPNQEMN